jgi:hypothetical protein
VCSSSIETQRSCDEIQPEGISSLCNAKAVRATGYRASLLAMLLRRGHWCEIKKSRARYSLSIEMLGIMSFGF